MLRVGRREVAFDALEPMATEEAEGKRAVVAPHVVVGGDFAAHRTAVGALFVLGFEA
jgi:hypothetical protein